MGMEQGYILRKRPCALRKDGWYGRLKNRRLSQHLEEESFLGLIKRVVDEEESDESIRCLKDFLKNKQVDFSAVNSEGNAALVMVVQNRLLRTMQLLLDHGADPDVGFEALSLQEREELVAYSLGAKMYLLLCAWKIRCVEPWRKE